ENEFAGRARPRGDEIDRGGGTAMAVQAVSMARAEQLRSIPRPRRPVFEQGQGGFGTCFVGLLQSSFPVFLAPARDSSAKKIRAKYLDVIFLFLFDVWV